MQQSTGLRHRFTPENCSILNMGQVCRQIRMEFHHPYFVQARKWIPLSWIERYLATFHSGNDTVADRVTVDLIELTSWHTREDNLLVLLTNLSHLPNVAVTFDHSVFPGHGRSLIGLGPLLTRCATKASTTE
jgi:hypothetical protein